MGTPAVIPITDAVLAEIVSRLVACFQPERIYLFGSRARGDMGPDSDYDLLMVLDRLDRPAGTPCERTAWSGASARPPISWSGLARR